MIICLLFDVGFFIALYWCCAVLVLFTYVGLLISVLGCLVLLFGGLVFGFSAVWWFRS